MRLTNGKRKASWRNASVYQTEGTVRAVKPFALDVCSGLRTAGALDAVKVDAFMRAVRSVD